MKTRIVRFYEIGGPEVLQIEEQELPVPGRGEVCVRIQAIGLNRAEAAFRAGQYIEPPNLPAGLGYEASGEIEAIGEDVNGLAVGDSVCVIPAFSMNDYSVYAEYAIVPVNAIVKRPAGIGDVDGAAIWMAYLTAYGALIDLGQLAKDETVLITAASSSVGLAAIQIANSIGAIPIAVTRTEEKKEALLKAGAAHVIVSQTQDLVEETMRITDGRGANIAFDPIAGPGVEILAASLAQGGTLFLYGNLSGQAFETLFPFGLAVGKGLNICGYLVFHLVHNPEKFTRAQTFINEGLKTGKLKPQIARTFSFNDIIDAHRYLESNQQLGKVVVTV